METHKKVWVLVIGIIYLTLIAYREWPTWSAYLDARSLIGIMDEHDNQALRNWCDGTIKDYCGRWMICFARPATGVVKKVLFIRLETDTKMFTESVKWDRRDGLRYLSMETLNEELDQKDIAP